MRSSVSARADQAQKGTTVDVPGFPGGTRLGRRCLRPRTELRLRMSGSPHRRSRSGHQVLQVQEVSYVGLTDSATAQPLFKLAIRPG
jgi:hypothetical protein